MAQPACSNTESTQSGRPSPSGYKTPVRTPLLCCLCFTNARTEVSQKEKPPKSEDFGDLTLNVERKARQLSLGELRSATGGFEAVLREFLSCFSLIFRAFPAFCFSVIRYADHKKSPFFIQR